jgi:hypothetical protein
MVGVLFRVSEQILNNPRRRLFMHGMEKDAKARKQWDSRASEMHHCELAGYQ